MLVRLICAGLIGVAAFVLSFQLEFDLRILLGYDLGISAYLAILLVRMANADAETTREVVEDAMPDFWDFMYFSFTLAICYQVSDVSIRSRHLRRVVLAHVLLSFLNVTMILGLVVEIVSTMTNPSAPMQ